MPNCSNAMGHFHQPFFFVSRPNLWNMKSEGVTERQREGKRFNCFYRYPQNILIIKDLQRDRDRYQSLGEEFRGGSNWIYKAIPAHGGVLWKKPESLKINLLLMQFCLATVKLISWLYQAICTLGQLLQKCSELRCLFFFVKPSAPFFFSF